MSAILRERAQKMKNSKYKKHKLVSKIPSYRVISLKLTMEWKLLEQHMEHKKHTASSSPQIWG